MLDAQVPFGKQIPRNRIATSKLPELASQKYDMNYVKYCTPTIRTATKTSNQFDFGWTDDR